MIRLSCACHPGPLVPTAATSNSVHKSVVEELERGVAQRHGLYFFHVAVGQGFRQHICRTGLEFDMEIKPKELASPLVLGDCR
jgi:hypothetical protein